MRNLAFIVAALQLTVAAFAVYSSNRDILSDGACIGGIFGTLANILILSVAVVAALVLSTKPFRESRLRRGVKPLLILASSSSVAILIGQYAALRCTV